MTATLLLRLKAAVGMIIFAIGMDSTAKDAAHLLHRPGLLVLAASAGAPLLPRKPLRIGDGAYIFSLVLLSSLLAIVVVPA